MDAGARTSLFQIKRRACGGRPMTAAAARARRRVLCATRGGLGDVSSSTRVRSETLVQRCVLVTVPPHVAMCPRSFNQALLLSTRWMFGRVNRMVVIGRFGCVFWCEGGWWRTPIRAGQAQRAPMRRVAAPWRGLCTCEACCVVCCGAAARARDRALFAAAVDAIHKRQLTSSCALSRSAEAGASGQ